MVSIEDGQMLTMDITKAPTKCPEKLLKEAVEMPRKPAEIQGEARQN